MGAYRPRRLFVERDRPPFVLVRSTDGAMYVNYEDVSHTRALYDELAAAVNRAQRR